MRSLRWCIFLIVSDALAQDPGKALYQAKCAPCHGDNQFGTVTLYFRNGSVVNETTRPLIFLDRREGLQKEFIRQAVRAGLRNMPPLTRIELRDDELDTISAFLEAPKPPPASR